MAKYAQHFNTRVTPQTEAIPGKPQVKNSAGGFSFAVNDWQRLDRFLILGSEGGSYYADEKTLTKENAKAVLKLIEKDGEKVVDRIVEISDHGRAPKNDPAIFALALALKLGDPKTRRAAALAISKVCRIGTHLFQFAESAKALGGTGPLYRRAIGSWYVDQKPDQLAMNVVKYQNREGWSHKDMLREAHLPKGTRSPLLYWIARDGDLSSYFRLRFKHGTEPKAAKEAREKYITTGELDPCIEKVDMYPAMSREELPKLIGGFEAMKLAKTPAEAVKLIEEYGLPRETVPTELLNSVEVWDALLRSGKGMPYTAMVRNLGKMSAIGLLTSGSKASKFVSERLTDMEIMKRARVHPMNLLMAQAIYRAGQGMKGHLTWTPDKKIVSELDEAFYLAFKLVEPTGKRFLLGIDVSGSMTSSRLNGSPLTAREASSAMAMVTMRTEENYVLGGFTTGKRGSTYGWGGGQNHFARLEHGIKKEMSLPEICAFTSGLDFGGTDCALPMLYAKKEKIPVDVFVIYTDSESYAGHIHASQALVQYREQMGIPAKMVVMAMTANSFSVADPSDAGQMDVVGFDSNVPQIVADFIRGQ